jgi:hypothetical protein
VFAVIGEWRMNPQHGADQSAGLASIASGVAQLPGLVKGYWTNSEDGTRAHLHRVRRQAAAEAFATDVRGNVENQRRAGMENVSLVIDEVSAET